MSTVSLTITGLIQFTRGLKANLPTTGLTGQALFCTDTGELFVRNGSAMVGLCSSGRRNQRGISYQAAAC